MDFNRVEDLKRITREVLGSGPGRDFFFRADRLLEEGGATNAALLSAAKKIEIIVKLYINEEDAARLGERYREYLKKNATYL